MSLTLPFKLCGAGLKSKWPLEIALKPFHCCAVAQVDLPGRLLYKNNPLSTPRLIPHQIRHESTREPKLSLFQRFKQMYRDYWYVLVPVHLVTSAAWFGSFYYLASSGVDIPSLLESVNVNEKIVNSMRNSSMGYVAISYGLYKIATPLRYTVTLGGTTISINYLKKWGYIKPMPSKERLKEMYAETREGMKEKRENLMETVHNIQQTVKDTKEGIKDRKDSIVTSVKESKESIQKIKKKVLSSTVKNDNKS